MIFQTSGAANDGFFLNALKTLFRVPRVPFRSLEMQILTTVLSGPIKHDKFSHLFGHHRGSRVFSKLQGFQFYFTNKF